MSMNQTTRKIDDLNIEDFLAFICGVPNKDDVSHAMEQLQGGQLPPPEILGRKVISNPMTYMAAVYAKKETIQVVDRQDLTGLPWADLGLHIIGQLGKLQNKFEAAQLYSDWVTFFQLYSTNCENLASDQQRDGSILSNLGWTRRELQLCLLFDYLANDNLPGAIDNGDLPKAVLDPLIGLPRQVQVMIGEAIRSMVTPHGSEALHLPLRSHRHCRPREALRALTSRLLRSYLDMSEYFDIGYCILPSEEKIMLAVKAKLENFVPTRLME